MWHFVSVERFNHWQSLRQPTVRLWSILFNETFRISYCELDKHVGLLRINFGTILKNYIFIIVAPTQWGWLFFLPSHHWIDARGIWQPALCCAPATQGEAVSLPPDGMLGLLLCYLGSQMTMKWLCLNFGITPTPCSRILKKIFAWLWSGCAFIRSRV